MENPLFTLNICNHFKQSKFEFNIGQSSIAGMGNFDISGSNDLFRRENIASWS